MTAAGTMAPAADATWRPRHNPWLIAAAVTLAAFMEILDTTIVNVALRYIAGDLAVSNDDATWVLTSYLVSNGIVLTISGWLGDVLGRKRYFLICIAMFTVCSLLCGTSTSLAELIVFRLAQGFFGGGMQPNQQSIILDTFPPAKRGAAFGLAAIATVVAPALGPTLGGYIVDQWSWRWIFFINIPTGAVAVFLVSVLVEDPPWLRKKKSRGIDYIGLSLITIGLGCLQIMMDRGEDDDWFGSNFIRLMALLAFLGIFGAIGWLLIAKKPIVSLMVLIPIVTVLVEVVQTRYVIAFGFLVLGFGLIFTSTIITPDVDFRTLVMARTIQSAGFGFLLVPINTVAFLTLPRDLNNDGAALFAMFRNVSGSIGISLATAAITERTQVHQSYLSQWTTPLYQPFETLIATYEQALRAMGRAGSAVRDDAIGQMYQVFRVQAAVLAFADIFMYAAIVAFIMIPVSFLVAPITCGPKPTPHHAGVRH